MAASSYHEKMVTLGIKLFSVQILIMLTLHRLYTQLDISTAGEISKSRAAKDENIAESGGKIEVSSITADEVLAQANLIFSPYKLKFAAPLSWFAIWKSM